MTEVSDLGDLMVFGSMATAVTYAIFNGLKRIEEVDVFDRQTDFRPMRF